MPEKTKAIIVPTKLKCSQPGTYSIGLKCGTVSKIVAKDIQLKLPGQELSIEPITNFECTVTQVNQAAELYLLNEKEKEPVGGLVPILDEISDLEPPSDPKMDSTLMFAPQQLKY